ncbi:MAG: HAMP domain-containing sensor histidine kinase [Pseudomonadota bacterium]
MTVKDAIAKLARFNPSRLFRLWRGSLSARLLFLTALFVFIAEIFVFMPSIAKFRLDWLTERLEAAQLAALAVETAPDQTVSEQIAQQLLAYAEVEAITLLEDDARILILSMGTPPSPPVMVDLKTFRPVAAVVDAGATFFAPKGQLLRVAGAPSLGGGMGIEIVVPSSALKRDMLAYSRNIFFLSLIISVFTATLVFFSLRRNFVTPMVRLMENMVSFQNNPEDSRKVMRPSGRDDEIGMAETVLAEMQTELRSALNRKERLAALGAGVAKINHDLRNVLASAQLVSDRLSKSEDPRVQKLAPRLVKALGRAVTLCQDTLQYGKAEETELNPASFSLRELVNETLDAVDRGEDGIALVNAAPDDLAIVADREQLFRILLNISRNAAQAIAANDAKDRRGQIRINAALSGSDALIDISDTGPGLPPKAQDHLFEPFKGSARPGGSGLGLAIAAELARAHGGAVSLLSTGPEGTVFRIRLPQEG